MAKLNGNGAKPQAVTISTVTAPATVGELREVRCKLSPEAQARAEQVLELFAEGRSLRKACRRIGVRPTSFCRWVLTDEWLAEQYEIARQLGADLRASDIEDTAESALRVAMKADPKRAHAAVSAIKLKVDTLKWTTSRMHPKRYGDRVDVTSGDKPLASATAVLVVVPIEQVIPYDPTKASVMPTQEGAR